MKSSNYNLLYTRENGDRIAYNTYSGVISRINNDFENILNCLGDGPTLNIDPSLNNLTEQMKKVGYIVDDCEEFEKINHLSHKQRFDSRKIKIVIAPTLECNFGCPYCYETPRKGYMTKEIMDKIYSFVINRIESYKIEGVSVVWYGGEPLLYPEIIGYLSSKLIKYCKEYKIAYNASIITNGFLINSEIISLMKNAFISFAQITIDGIETVHNSRRFLLRPSDSNGTFKTIINNINLLTNEKIRVGIRVNIDSGNKNIINDLVDKLDTLLYNKEYIGIYLGHIFDDKSNDECSNCACISKELFADLKIDLINRLHSTGFHNIAKKNIPKTRLNYCSATFLNSFVFSPIGKMFKCWNEICEDEKSFADINDLDILDNDKLEFKMSKWITYDFSDNIECQDCKFSPICAGGCPKERINNKNSVNCEDIKYNAERLINFLIDNKIE